MQTWIAMDELTTKFGVNSRDIRRKIASGKFVGRDSSRKARNGQPIQEILIESLPAELQEKICRRAQPKIVEPSPENTDVSSENVDHLMRFSDAERSAFLAEALRLADIVRRFEQISPKRARRDGQLVFTEAVEKLAAETVCKCEIVLKREPSRAKGVSAATLYRWHKSKDDLSVFFRKPSTVRSGADKRLAAYSAGFETWFESNWRSASSARQLFKKAKKAARENRWLIPSESWFYRQWTEIPDVVKATITGTKKRYTERLASYYPRDFSDLGALQVLCGDHSQRDVTVVMPDGRLIRPWFSVWQCLATGLIWGWHLDETPSALTSGLAYARGVRTFGAQPPARPEDGYFSYLYTDQGRDYKGKSWDGQTLVFKQAMNLSVGLKSIITERRVGFFDETGIKHLLARGYNAKEKPVERIFRDFSDWEQEYFAESYCGRDAKNKPDLWVKNWHAHQRWLKRKQVGDAPFVTFEDYLENLENFINEYNSTAHLRTTQGNKQIVPLERFDELYRTRFEIAEETLALLLMKAQKRTIGKNGIEIFGQQYLHPQLAAYKEIYKKTDVEVRYDDNDLNQIWVVLPNNGGILKVDRLVRGGLLDVNKQTIETVKRTQAEERRLQREYRALQERRLRGETAEMTVARQLGQNDFDEPERMPVAVGERPSMSIISRFDGAKTSFGSITPAGEDESSADILQFQTRVSEQPRRIKIQDFDFEDTEEE